MRSLRTLSLSLTVFTAALCPSVRAADLRNFEDASLHAVQFWDTREGWAVGDEGVIWHTIDGGKHWERQPSGVRASLRSLHFLDPYTGWVVGREELPCSSPEPRVIHAIHPFAVDLADRPDGGAISCARRGAAQL